MLAAWVVFVGAGGYDFYLNHLFVHYPRHAIPTLGETIPYHWKGIVIYLTNSQAHILHLLHVLELTSLAIAAIYFFTSRILARRTNSQ